jgi:CRP/FNR family transcriptional regulator, cyclic AMP receptor protein
MGELAVRKVLYLLGQLNDRDCEWLVKVGRLHRVDKGESLVVEGKPVDAIYIVIDGKLAVSARKMGVIAQIGSGELVGEMSLVDSRPASASVSAVDGSAMLRVPRDVLLAKIEEDVAFSARLHRAIAMFLADRMRSTIEHMGYGESSALDLDEGEETMGEIDMEVLDRVHLAGARFDRVFRSLLNQGAR